MGGVNGPDLAGGLDRATTPTPREAADMADQHRRDLGSSIYTRGETAWFVLADEYHARATTPGDDRGRQALASLTSLALALVFDQRPDDAAQIERAVDDLRALAAPAETEAGDDELARTLRSLHSTLVTPGGDD